MQKLNIGKNFIDKLAEYKVKCKHCGHTMTMVKVKFKICNYCGHKVYKNEKEEFEDKLKRELKSHH